jgi:hypothetical protein
MTTHRTILAGALLALTVPATAQTWSQLSPTNSPAAQGWHQSMAFHFATGRTVLYGGRTTSVLTDTWTFNGTDWILESPANNPGPRWGHRLVQETARGRILLFGGRDGGTTAQNETWAWDGVDWTRILTANSPSARAWHQMAYDSRRGVTVVYGGFASLDNATWEFDGTDWSPRTTATRPPRVGDGVMVYDESRGVCVLFGGFDNSTAVYAGTWEYDGRDWRSVATANVPPNRIRHQMSYDPALRQVVMHGGFGGGALSDVWTYDGSDWTQQFPGGPAPTVPLEGAMTYDYVSSAHLNFGGRGPTGSSGDTHLYRSVGSASYAPAGAGCAGSAGVPQLAGLNGSVPRTGTAFSATVGNLPAAASSVVVLFGLSNGGFAGAPLPYALDVLGMTGCWLDIATDTAFTVPAAGGTATFTLNVPATITDAVFWNQAFVVDPSAPGGAILSNACRGYIRP